MVRFWDTSALIPLVVEEGRSSACRRLFRDKADLVVWALTRTEMTSAVWRRAREGDLASGQVPRALARIAALSSRWSEITDIDLVRDRAERLLGQHALRAADALQLGAALVLTRERPRGRDLVTVDGELARAAANEGFRVLVPTN
ncbi:MAG TPA: type II toxin-antitoxin system VapC family toxin [Polyangia bacterium]|nr:type II toxin-antitoxin system VapC family toxin [Polyangia bacterium]